MLFKDFLHIISPMTATIEASATNKDSQDFEVKHPGDPRVRKIPLKNGKFIMVYDGSISFLESTASIVENHGSEVKRVPQPSLRRDEKGDAHIVIIFQDTGWARITQNDKLPEINQEGFDLVDVHQIEMPVYSQS